MRSRVNDNNGPILVVDDDPMLRTSLTRILRTEGHDVIDTASGPEALSMIRNYRPRLVILDTSLRGMDGEMVLGTAKFVYC